MLRYRRPIAAGTGVALAAVGVGADALSIGGSPGFGSFQWLLLAMGAGILPFAALSGAWLRTYERLTSLLFFSYVGLLLFELGLSSALGSPRTSGDSLRGYVQPARWGGYQLTPNWHGFYDDGRTRLAVDINSRGDRDDEPERQPPAARLSVLLLGDSQTFGIGLRREETIESRIESLSAGEVAAYNLGVPGYGPRALSRTHGAGGHSRVLPALRQRPALRELPGRLPHRLRWLHRAARPARRRPTRH
jgi:hypothetical protein